MPDSQHGGRYIKIPRNSSAPPTLMNARNDKGLAQKRQTISVSSPSGNEKQYAAAETQPPSPMSNDSIPAELSTFSINSHVQVHRQQSLVFRWLDSVSVRRYIA